MPDAVVEDSALTTYAEPNGTALHHYRFRIRNWTQRSIPVRLPPTSTLMAARVDGRWLMHVARAPAEDGTVLVDMPAASGTGSPYYELMYSAPIGQWSCWTRVDAPVPSMPVRTIQFRRSWCFPSNIQPLNDRWLQTAPIWTTQSFAVMILPDALVP